MKRFLNVLLTNNYTIVLIEQTTPPPDPVESNKNLKSRNIYRRGERF